MAADKNSGGTITLAQATDLMAHFDKKFPGQIKSQFIGSVNVQKILSQKDCIGLQIYYGYDASENRLNMFMMGVDSDGNTMQNLIMDRMLPCPPECPPTGP